MGGARAEPRWKSLPGAGRKTANVVLNMAFGEPTLAVDTHMFRVANRTGLAPGKTCAKSRWAGEGDAAQFMLDAHHWLILHGRYTCFGPRAEMRGVPDPRSLPLAGKDGVGPGRVLRSHPERLIEK